MTTREIVRSGIDFSSKTLVEIGPLYRPFVLKSEANVIYVDHADTESLREKYKDDPKFDKSTIVDVDAVWGEQTLLECLGGRKVDYVIASHVIEHVPDLLTWLAELRSVLTENGEIRLVIPDKRFTFDYTRRLTELPEVLDAFLRKTRRPLSWNVLDHAINVREVDAVAAWRGPLELKDIPLYHSVEAGIFAARDVIETTNYHDVHCWVFTPYSFAKLMGEAAEHGLLGLSCEFFEDTPRNSLEFIVHARASVDREKILDSWKRMEGVANRAAPGSVEEQVEALEQARSEIAVQTERIKSLESKLAEALASQQATGRALQVALAETQRYSQSTSWKLTAPIRKIVTALRRS